MISSDHNDGTVGLNATVVYPLAKVVLVPQGLLIVLRFLALVRGPKHVLEDVTLQVALELLRS